MKTRKILAFGIIHILHKFSNTIEKSSKMTSKTFHLVTHLILKTYMNRVWCLYSKLADNNSLPIKYTDLYLSKHIMSYPYINTHNQSGTVLIGKSKQQCIITYKISHWKQFYAFGIKKTYQKSHKSWFQIWWGGKIKVLQATIDSWTANWQFLSQMIHCVVSSS